MISFAGTLNGVRKQCPVCIGGKHIPSTGDSKGKAHEEMEHLVFGGKRGMKGLKSRQ